MSGSVFASSTTMVFVAAVFVLAGAVKGVVGLGLPTVSMALLALAMQPAEAAALLVVPSLVTNVWQLRPWSTVRRVATRIAMMQVGVVAGTLAGALWFGAPAGAWATTSLGIALLAYAAWGLAGSRLVVTPAAERALGPWIGGVTGLVTAATGVFVIPAVPWLQALSFERDALVQAMGITFTVSTVALALGLCLNGRYPAAAFGGSLVMLLPALSGMAIGQALRQRLSPELFRRWLFIALLLLGVHMVVHAGFTH